MDRLDTIRLFVRVVETSSFSKAARLEGVVQSTASKQVAALEKRLGTQLLRRTSRGLSTTEAGRDFYDTVGQILAELAAAEVRAMQGQGVPSGQLRVAVPTAFGRMHIVPLLATLLERYPGLRIDHDAGDRYVNLVEEGIDVAIRIGQLSDSTLVARRIGAFEIATVASKSYVERHGEPRRPGDLGGHACVTFMFRGSPRPWEFGGPKGSTTIAPAGPLRFHDAESVRAAVLAGLGVGHAPAWLFAEEIAAGTVSRLLTVYVPAPVSIHAVCSSGKAVTSKAKAFIDFLAESFAASDWLKTR